MITPLERQLIELNQLMVGSSKKPTIADVIALINKLALPSTTNTSVVTTDDGTIFIDNDVINIVDEDCELEQSVTIQWNPTFYSPDHGSIPTRVKTALYIRLGHLMMCTVECSLDELPTDIDPSCPLYLAQLPIKSASIGGHAGQMVVAYFNNVKPPLGHISGILNQSSDMVELIHTTAHTSHSLTLDQLEPGFTIIGTIWYLAPHT